MKPITEQERQELIERLKKIAAWEKTYGAQHNVMLPASEARELAEIALASLTAKVFMHGISDPDGKAYFSECCVDDDGSGVSDEVCALNDGETDVDGGYQVVKLYTAPPVPVIKLPGAVEFNKQSKTLAFDKGFSVGFNECIEEIKNLNGLGE